MSARILLFLISLRMLCLRSFDNRFTALTLHVAVDVKEPMVSSTRRAIATVASNEVCHFFAPTESIAGYCLPKSRTRHVSFSLSSLPLVPLHPLWITVLPRPPFAVTPFGLHFALEKFWRSDHLI